MKKLLLLVLTGLSAGYLRADITELLEKAKEIGAEVASLAGPTKAYPKDTDISFEIRNKSDDELFFSIASDGRSIKEDGSFFAEDESTWLKVGSKKTAQIPLDISKATAIRIYNPTTGDEELYTVPNKKTLYLTWDAKVLRPQTGPGRGFLGKTETGLSIKNNVSKKDVVKLLVIPAGDDEEESEPAEGVSS